MLKSGDLCTLLGISKPTLFRWEEEMEGFPQPQRGWKMQQRLWDEEDLKQIAPILSTLQRNKAAHAMSCIIEQTERRLKTLKKYLSWFTETEN